MSVTAQQVKELRDMTGVGMMDCKKALAETDGDMEAAIDWLRTRGLAKAAKKAGRVAAEGLVGINIEGTKGSIVEVNSETDFVARNEQFQSIVGNVAKLALDADGDVGKLSEMPYPGSGRSVSAELTDAIAKIGENMNLRRTATIVGVRRRDRLVCPQHGQARPRQARRHRRRSSRPVTRLRSPTSASRSPCTSPTPTRSRSRPTTSIRTWWRASVRSSPSRPRNRASPLKSSPRWSKAVSASSTKKSTLLAQTFVIDGETKVGDVVKNAEKEVGAPIKVTGFVRYALGEGIEKEETDFAAEVAATAGVNK